MHLHGGFSSDRHSLVFRGIWALAMSGGLSLRIAGWAYTGLMEAQCPGHFFTKRAKCHIFVEVCYTPVIKHSHGKSPFSIGNTSSKGSFSIAMLDYQRVTFFLIYIYILIHQYVHYTQILYE